MIWDQLEWPGCEGEVVIRCLNQLTSVAMVFLITHFDFVATGTTLARADARGPCLLSWKLHTHRFSCTQWGKWFYLSVVIEFLLVFQAVQSLFVFRGFETGL